MSKRKTAATLFHDLPPAAQKKVLKNLQLDIEVDFIPLSKNTKVSFSDLNFYTTSVQFPSTYADVMNGVESLLSSKYISRQKHCVDNAFTVVVTIKKG